MSEVEPTPEQNDEPKMSIEHNGIKFEMTRDNTAAYIHEEEPDFDHLFYSQDGGYFYLFRRSVANFDEVANYMKRRGYEVYDEEVFAPEQDKEQYFELFGYPEIKTRELTKREEHRIAFARWLLDHEHVTPGSFCEPMA